MRWWLFPAIVVFASCNREQTASPDFATKRHRMVQEQLVARGIRHQRILSVMAKVAREQFVSADFRNSAYDDSALPIGYDQTISQPYIVALMTEQLEPKPNDRILEIGTGSGYQAAILAELVAEVYTIEVAEPLANNAKARLQQLGYKNVHLRVGNGYEGWPEQAPFDGIIVTCAPAHVPQPLIEQLKEGGRMSIPVGPQFAQQLYLLRKQNNQMHQTAVLPVRFVPMIGRPPENK